MLWRKFFFFMLFVKLKMIFFQKRLMLWIIFMIRLEIFILNISFYNFISIAKETFWDYRLNFFPFAISRKAMHIRNIGALRKKRRHIKNNKTMFLEITKIKIQNLTQKVLRSHQSIIIISQSCIRWERYRKKGEQTIIISSPTIIKISI